jgi:serine/threonine protein phosphatase PrpC
MLRTPWKLAGAFVSEGTYADVAETVRALRAAFRRANAKILMSAKDLARAGMGITLTAAVIVGHSARIVPYVIHARTCCEMADYVA